MLERSASVRAQEKPSLPAALNELLKRHFTTGVSLTVVLGCSFPSVSDVANNLTFFKLPGGWSFDLPTATLYAMMLSASIATDPTGFVRLARAPRAFTIALVLFYAVLPVIGWLTANAARHALGGEIGAQFAAGILLVVLMPVAMTSTVWVRLARGEMPLTIAMTTLTTALSVIATPIYLAIMMGLSHGVSVPTESLVKVLALCIVAPLGIGFGIRFVARAWAERWEPVFAVAGKLALYILMFANVGATVPHLARATVPMLLTMIGVVVSLNFLSYALALVAGRVADLDYADQAALGYAGGMRSSGTALVIGLKSFAAFPFITIPATIFIVSQHLFAGAFQKLLRRFVPFSEKVVDRLALVGELRRLDARFRRPRKVTLTMVRVLGLDADRAAQALGATARKYLRAADLVAVQGADVFIALVAPHDGGSAHVIEHMQAEWEGGALTLRVAHEIVRVGRSLERIPFAACEAEIDVAPASARGRASLRDQAARTPSVPSDGAFRRARLPSGA